MRAQAHQIEHVDRPWPVTGLELREYFFGRIDVAHSAFPENAVACAILVSPRRTS
jgi:hypothetical protein